MKKRFFILVLMSTLIWGPGALAQEAVAPEEISQDDLGNVSDDFKEYFFNALSAKAIGNHDKAINFLQRCDQLKPNSGAVQFELAKNYLMSESFTEAETYLQKAIQLEGKKEVLLETLYDIYDKQQDYTRSIQVLEELAAMNENYEELLPFQYMRLEMDQKALAIIEKLDKRLGQDQRRNFVRMRIESRNAQQERENSSIEQLEARIIAQPKNEQAYINLMYLYSQQGASDQVIAVAQKLEENIPSSEKAHLALYKIYLDQGNIDKGVASMEKVFASDVFDTETKANVLKDFIKTGNSDAQVAVRVKDAIDEFADQVEDVYTYQVLADFYLSQNQAREAISFYQKAWEEAPKNYDFIKNIILLSIDLEDYQAALASTEEALEVFPAQALLYLLSGVAYNNLQEPQKAIDQLEMGLSFLLDETKLESDMYQQLAISYDQLGNTTKAASMRSKVEALSKKLQ